VAKHWVDVGKASYFSYDLILTWPNASASEPSGKKTCDPCSVVIENVPLRERDLVELMLDSDQGEIGSFEPRDDLSVVVTFKDEEGNSDLL